MEYVQINCYLIYVTNSEVLGPRSIRFMNNKHIYIHIMYSSNRVRPIQLFLDLCDQLCDMLSYVPYSYR